MYEIKNFHWNFIQKKIQNQLLFFTKTFVSFKKFNWKKKEFLEQYVCETFILLEWKSTL